MGNGSQLLADEVVYLAVNRNHKTICANETSLKGAGEAASGFQIVGCAVKAGIEIYPLSDRTKIQQLSTITEDDPSSR